METRRYVVDPLVTGNKSVLEFRRRPGSGPFSARDPASFLYYMNTVNATAWMGKEARSYMFVATRPSEGDPGRETLLVGYRPRGWVSYDGSRRLDGWRADDEPGDGDTQPEAAEGPKATDYHEFDFGEFLGEFDGRTGLRMSAGG